MTGKLRLFTTYARTILISIVFIRLFYGLLGGDAAGQTPPRSISSDLYAGIELCAEGAKAIMLRYSRDEESPGAKLIYSEVVHISITRTSSGDFDPQTANEAALAVKKLLTRLRQEYRV